MSLTRALISQLRAVFITLIVSCGMLLSGFGDEASGGDNEYHFNDVEQCFMRKINNKREANGKSELNRDKQLGYVARKHATWMANHDTVQHDGDIGENVTNWSVLGQNTGEGKNCKGLFKSFWNSSAHRANILGSFRFLGVGTKSQNGRLYVQQVFESKDNPGNVWHYP